MLACLTALYAIGGAGQYSGWRQAVILLLGLPTLAVLVIACAGAGNIRLRFDDVGVSYCGWFRTLDAPLSSVTMVGWIVIPGLYGAPTTYQFIFTIAGHRLPYTATQITARQLAERLATSEQELMNDMQLAMAARSIPYRARIPNMSPNLLRLLIVLGAIILPIGATFLYYQLFP